MMRRARISIALLVALVLVSCTGDEGNRGVADEGMLTAPITLPEPEPVEPAFLIAVPLPSDGAVEAARAVPGATALATVDVHRVRVRGPAGRRTLRVGAVAPLRYRSLAPDATEAADHVWTSLLAGQTVLTFDAAAELEVEDGTTLRFPEMGRVTVGAVADNGAPNLVDALVDEGIMHQSEPEATLLIVGARAGTARSAMERELETALPDMPMRPMLAMFSGALSTPAPEATAEANAGPIEAMAYRAVDDGFVKPNGVWVERNLVTEDLPIVGEATCHRLLMPQLSAALGELEAEGLSTLIDASQYGGCYVPRFIDRDPSKPLSMHAFGLAVDLNVSTNQLGTTGSMDPRVVDTFERWGFRWGGRWARPDPMHFELERLVDADPL
jgi:hypothetical protein